MIKRMLLAEYRKRGFVGRPPGINTLKRMIQRGDLPGEKIGGLWFVLVDENGEPANSLGDPLADSALRRWQDQRAAQ